MSDYGEPWLWGYWNWKKKPDRTLWMVFEPTEGAGFHEGRELWANVQYGDEVRLGDWRNGRHNHTPLIWYSDDFYHSDNYEQVVFDRGVECVNALAGLKPDGIARLLELVHKVVVAAQEARRQGWEDHTNFTQTLELALAACYDGPVTSVPSSLP